MPLTYSITNGIGAGFLAYTFLKLVSGKSKDVSMPMWFASVAFLIYFADPFIRKFLS
jgi:AGZA family xanthine/uracil permease-like MFS transporter